MGPECQDFLSFYRFVLLLLPEKDFDQLGGLWVALKAAHDAYEVGWIFFVAT